VQPRTGTSHVDVDTSSCELITSTCCCYCCCYCYYYYYYCCFCCMMVMMMTWQHQATSSARLSHSSTSLASHRKAAPASCSWCSRNFLPRTWAQVPVVKLLSCTYMITLLTRPGGGFCVIHEHLLHCDRRRCKTIVTSTKSRRHLVITFSQNLPFNNFVLLYKSANVLNSLDHLCMVSSRMPS